MKVAPALFIVSGRELRDVAYLARPRILPGGPNDHRHEAMNVDPMPEDDPTVPIIQGGDPRPLRATQPFRLIRAATPRFRRRRPSPRTSSNVDGRTLAHTSKYDESMAALEDVDRRLLAGEIGRSEHGGQMRRAINNDIQNASRATYKHPQRNRHCSCGRRCPLARNVALGSYIDHLSSYL